MRCGWRTLAASCELCICNKVANKPESTDSSAAPGAPPPLCWLSTGSAASVAAGVLPLMLRLCRSRRQPIGALPTSVDAAHVSGAGVCPPSEAGGVPEEPTALGDVRSKDSSRLVTEGGMTSSSGSCSAAPFEIGLGSRMISDADPGAGAICLIALAPRPRLQIGDPAGALETRLKEFGLLEPRGELAIASNLLVLGLPTSPPDTLLFRHLATLHRLCDCCSWAGGVARLLLEALELSPWACADGGAMW